MSGSDATASRARLAAAAAIAAVALAGCAAPRAPAGPGPDGRVHEWSGRFSAAWTGPGDAAEQSATGRFTLAENDDRVDLELVSPFGQTVARAGTSPRGARLETADGRRFEAPDPESLTQSALGWRMPIGHLPAWLRGEFSAGAASRPAGGEQRETVEAGWSIAVEDGESGRPARLALRWPAGDGGAAARVRIRLVLDGESARARP